MQHYAIMNAVDHYNLGGMSITSLFNIVPKASACAHFILSIQSPLPETHLWCGCHPGLAPSISVTSKVRSKATPLRLQCLGRAAAPSMSEVSKGLPRSFAGGGGGAHGLRACRAGANCEPIAVRRHEPQSIALISHPQIRYWNAKILDTPIGLTELI